jgi:RimJ/RimL family protein N-acetyltransferase
MTDAPTLYTERLILRAHCVEDFPALAAMWADPEVTKHIGEPSDEQRSWARLLSYGGLWSLLGFGYWAVQEKATGAYVGNVGFGDFHREIEPAITGIPEVGWVLSAPVHGKGYGTEAVRAALTWGDSHLATRRTVCIITPGNVASIGVAEKVGFREYARTTYMGDATLMFERLAP